MRHNQGWIDRFSGRDSCGDQAKIRAERAYSRCVKVDRIVFMVSEVSDKNSSLIRIAFIRNAVVIVVIARVVQVYMVEVDFSRYIVMICRSMYMGSTGHEADCQTEGTAAQGEDPTHAGDSTRLSPQVRLVWCRRQSYHNVTIHQ